MRKVSFWVLLCLLLGIALFPKEILLKFVAWKTASYCKEAFGAHLTYDELIWEDRKIVFKGGKVCKEGELEASFAEASLTPFFDLKQKAFGGQLKLEALKIFHAKKEPRPVPNPPSPSSKFFSFHLDTEIEGGELILCDFLAKHHFFQQCYFDLTHHVKGEETCGSIAFELVPDAPKFVTHFRNIKNQQVELSTHFQNHACSALSHLLTYFFQSYLPEPAFQWDVLEGTVDGELEMVLIEGAPMLLNGEIALHGVACENLPLKFFVEIEHIGCDLDIDFSKVSLINGKFDIRGGSISLKEDALFWQHMWDLKDLHSSICIKEGKLESSTLKGCLMGMEGELVLDLQSPSVLMEMSFRSASHEMVHFLPEKIRPSFDAAFPDDQFAINATVKRIKTGLELNGLLSINPAAHVLSFGCQLNGEQVEPDRCHDLSIPEHLNFSFSRSVDSFLDHLKQQFCLSQKRFGWFEGKGFPLEKFLSPFLLQNVKLKASGLADFKGTFDDRYAVIFYEGKDFCLDSPHFQFHVETVRKRPTQDITAVHYIDLQTWDHVGFLPLKDATYWQKNHGFFLEKTAAIVNFENKIIRIKNIETQSDGLHFGGDVKVVINSSSDVDLQMRAEYIRGSADSARHFLSHFKPSFFWEMPVEGKVSGNDHPLFFHYHFIPQATLVEGYVKGEVDLNISYPMLMLKNYRAGVEYDCKKNEIKVAEGVGTLHLAKGKKSLDIIIPALKLSELPDFCVDFSCVVKDGATSLLECLGSTSKSELGKEFRIISTNEKFALKAVQKQNLLELISFSFGDWIGEAQLAFETAKMEIHRFKLGSDQRELFSFAGAFDFKEKCLCGHVQQMHFTDLLSTRNLSWLPKEPIVGESRLTWNLGQEDSSIFFDDVKVEMSISEDTEKFCLGRVQYAPVQRKVFFEGFDFSFSSEKLAWLCQRLPIHEKCFLSEIKKQKLLEGHLSFEIDTDRSWVYLTLKDGAYCVADKQLDLKNFRFVYDPLELKLSTQIYYQDKFYWLHLNSEGISLKRGTIALSEQEFSSGNGDMLTAIWEKDSEDTCHIKTIEGNLSGMSVALVSCKDSSSRDGITLHGRVGFDPEKVSSLFHPSFQETIGKLSLKGGLTLEGDFCINRCNVLKSSFKGTLFGRECTLLGIHVTDLSSFLEYQPGKIVLSNVTIKDGAGSLFAHKADFYKDANLGWHFDSRYICMNDFRLSRLKCPWAPNPKEKSFFRFLCIPSFILEHFSGWMKNTQTFSGLGKLEFTNLPKRTLFSNLLFLPTEITARIGLDFSNLIPVKGTIEYEIKNGKICLKEFKEMYSDGKRSRFYLAEGTDAFVDFKGNLNMKVKMKQYNLLMKLAEFFTISVRGTLLHPTYTFSNHIENEEPVSAL